jgi:hypothetical protein
MSKYTKVVAAGAAALVTAGALVVGGTQVLNESAVTVTSVPPAPANLEVLAVDQTSVTLGWGPAQPGELYPGAATARSLVVNWGSARDDVHGPVTYTFSKNGKVLVRGLTRLYNKVGFTLAVRKFRACVWAVNTIGKSGPQMCATFNGI